MDPASSSGHAPANRIDVFPAAHGWNVNDLRITNAPTIHNHGYGYAGTGRSIAQRLNPLYDASHKRNRKLAPPDSQCLPGTRKSLLRELCSWVKSGFIDGQPPYEESQAKVAKPICWMYGSFGCGKSAIAQTMAEEFGRQKRLAAAFFFFRNAGDRSNLTRFADTLAHQIATTVPGAKALIERTIEDDPGLLHPACSLGSQLEHLVFEPLIACLAGGNITHDDPYLLLADGLDECIDKEGISHFIDLVVAFFSRHPDIPLRFFITSRVEEHIRTHVEDGHQIIHFVDLSNQSSRSDIKFFIQAFFTEARKRDRALQAVHDTWPSEEDMDQLVDYCDGSFIFGSTLARFVIGGLGDRDPRTPMERLPLAIDINPGIDGVYTEILSRAQHLPHFHIVISAIACLQKPLSISAMSVLLDLSTYDIIRILIQLQAVVHIPGRDDLPVTIFHTSMRDFLVDKDRSGHLHSQESHHTFLVHRCLELLLGTEPTANTECNKYAMVYWSAHLERALFMKGNEFLDGPTPTLRSNAAYRRIDLHEWRRRQYKSSRGERRTIIFQLSYDEWQTMRDNQQRLVNGIEAPGNQDYGKQLSIIRSDDVAWSTEFGSPLKHKSRQICSLNDVVRGLFISTVHRHAGTTLFNLKRGIGVSVVLQVHTLFRLITIDDKVDTD